MTCRPAFRTLRSRRSRASSRARRSGDRAAVVAKRRWTCRRSTPPRWTGMRSGWTISAELGSVAAAGHGPHRGGRHSHGILRGRSPHPDRGEPSRKDSMPSSCRRNAASTAMPSSSTERPRAGLNIRYRRRRRAPGRALARRGQRASRRNNSRSSPDRAWAASRFAARSGSA